MSTFTTIQNYLFASVVFAMLNVALFGLAIWAGTQDSYYAATFCTAAGCLGGWFSNRCHTRALNIIREKISP